MRTGSGARLVETCVGGTSPAAAAASRREDPVSPTGGGVVTVSEAEVKGQPPEEGAALVDTEMGRTAVLPLPHRPACPGPDPALEAG
jgi:hypothetical protein